MVEIPNYLISKLASVGIKTIEELHNYDYLKVYKWIKDLHPSIGKNVLFDLYSISNSLAINSISESIKSAILVEFDQLLPTYMPLEKQLIRNNLGKAQEQADIAFLSGEIPIGAVVIYKNNIIGVGSNQTISKCDIIAHAEIIAIQGAQKHLKSHRLTDCDLYVTVEPCIMCAGAIIHSRIKRVIFGATEPKTGAVISQYAIFANKQVNHHTETVGPLNNEYYGQQLTKFFNNKRREPII